MAVNRAADKYGDVDWIVRSHAHYFVFAGFSKQTGVITPCWKRRDVYAVKKGLLTPPDIGYVLFHIESDGEVTMERDVRHFGQAARLVRI